VTRSIAEYMTLRSRYQPDDLRLILVAESPPASGLEHGEPPPAAPVFVVPGPDEPGAADNAAIEPATAAHVDAGPPPPEPLPDEPAAAPTSRPADDVLVVTEKPANPRRGWWQRMMRS